MVKKSKVQETGNVLLDNMRSIISNDEELGKESSYIPIHSTTLDVLDYRNGVIEDGIKRVGINGSKISYIVGNSGTGKTTLVIQMACAIADEHEYGSVFHFDCERSSTRPRIRTLTRWSKEKFKRKYIHLDKNVTSESFYKLIKSIAKEKLDNHAKYEYDYVTEEGEEVTMLPPTVVILDSLALLVPNKIDNREELGGQMDATAAAKTNTAIFKGIMDSLVSANITLFVINHINEKVDTNMFAKKQAQVNFLAQDETLPGGRAPIFLSDFLLKLKSYTKLDPSKDFGIKGFMVHAELIKSRANVAGNKVTLVFNQAKGFSNVLSSFQYLKEAKKIQGSGHGYYIEPMPDVKFKLKTLEEIYDTNEEFRETFDNYVKEQLEEFLSGINDDESSTMVNESDLEYDAESELYYNHTTEKWYDLVEYEDGTQEYEEVED